MAETERYAKRKKRKKSNKPQRETFLKLYTRTCEKIYYLAFEETRNIHDCELIFRDAFVYMYDHIGELRKAASLEVWQKECVEKAFRSLLHTQLLRLVEDDDADSIDLSLSETKRDELWNRINKMADIDTWRNVPEPGKSTVFSVLADQTLSDLRYMGPADYAKTALIIFGVIAVLVVGVKFLVDFIESRQKVQIEITQEIFLDDSRYEGTTASLGSQVDENELSSIISNGEELQAEADAIAAAEAAAAAEDEEIASWNTANLSGTYTQMGISGRTSGEPVLTGDDELDESLKTILSEIITEEMGDFAAIEAIYDYVGKSIEFRHYSDEEKSYTDLLKEALEAHEGDSRHYSALLKALCNAAGYERCTVITGAFVFNADTDFERCVAHSWNRLILGGITYYLDVEADANADGSVVRRNYFMATSGNNRWKTYERDHYIP